MLYLFYFLICVTATTLGAISGIGGGPINLAEIGRAACRDGG